MLGYNRSLQCPMAFSQKHRSLFLTLFSLLFFLHGQPPHRFSSFVDAAASFKPPLSGPSERG